MSTIVNEAFTKARELCLPLVTTIELTQGCNYKCHHCYNFDRNQKSNSTSSQAMSKERILQLIEEVSQAGALYLNFTGGEVLLHPDLSQFVIKAREENLEVRIKTNGSLLTDERCRELQNAGLAGMDISLYGFSEGSYFQITNKHNVFDKSIQGILLAKKYGFDIQVSIIIHRYNIEELERMINFCQTNELSFQFSSEITERYDSSAGARNYEITVEQFSEQLKGPFADIFGHFNPEKSLQCSCAKSVCGVSFSGEVFPCIGAPIPSGNIHSQSFGQIWKRSPVLEKIRNLKNEDFKECMSCEFVESCNRSSGGIYVNTGKYTGCDPMTLAQAKIRHEIRS